MVSLPFRPAPVLLELDLTEPPVEPDPADPVARLRARRRPQLRSVLRTLTEAGKDRRVAGLVVKVGGPLSWPVMQELRLGVRAFAATGKPTTAWAQTFGEGPGTFSAYVLATACDEIWLQPGGGVGPLGVGLETTFLRGALDRLGVEPQFEQRHEYKNAVNVFTRTGFTAAHRESLERITESVFADAVAAAVERRDLTAEQFREVVDRSPLTASEALAAGLVDRLGHRDEAYDAARRRVSDDDPERVALLFADQWHPRRTIQVPGRHRGYVAAVEVRGAIVAGRTRRGPLGRQVGGDSVAAELRAAGADRDARALLLRVDSPGGSAVASEVIWREVCRLREAGMPVVVSMGDLAASGGYYVSCPADVIFALPATLTGSIGVFSGKFVARDLLERVGLTTGRVQQGRHALMYSGTRRFSSEERAGLARAVDAIYDDFVFKVARGRDRTAAEVEPLARGRVWTGADAVTAGLVDELGGFVDAARVARERADLPDDAAVRPALRVPPLARLGRPRNSEDPRAALAYGTGSPLLGLLAAGRSPGSSGHEHLNSLFTGGEQLLLAPPLTLL